MYRLSGKKAIQLLMFVLILGSPVMHAAAQDGALDETPHLAALVAFDRGQSDMQVVITRYDEDRDALLRRYDVPLSPVVADRMQRFYEAWMGALADLDFDGLNHEGQVDFILLRNRI